MSTRLCPDALTDADDVNVVPVAADAAALDVAAVFAVTAATPDAVKFSADTLVTTCLQT